MPLRLPAKSLPNEPYPPRVIIATWSAASAFIHACRRAKWPVWLITPYNDIDIREAAERLILVPPMTTCTGQHWRHVLAMIPKNTPVIYGSGMEHKPEWIGITPCLYGNAARTVRRIRKPKHFFTTLTKHGLRYPPTQTTPPPPSPLWLCKTTTSCGGDGITQHKTATAQPQSYYQKIINGHSISLTFLANGDRCVAIGFCSVTHAPTETKPMRLGTVSTITPERSLQKTLLASAQTLTRLYGLCGLNSIDSIIDAKGRVWHLEVNPRAGISLLLFDHPPLPPLLKWHWQTFYDKTLPDLPLSASRPTMPRPTMPRPTMQRSVHIIYARHDMVAQALPTSYRDRPPINSIIKKDDPICTFYEEKNIALSQPNMLGKKNTNGHQTYGTSPTK